MGIDGARTRCGYLDLPWGQVHCRTVDADPGLGVLILLHQSPLSSRTFEPALAPLARHVRPFALDTPGHGGSDRAPSVWEVEDYAAAVWSAVDALGATSVALLGRATGSVIALEAALQRPERVSRLVLHGLPVYTAGERTSRLASFAPPWEATDDGAHLGWIWDRVRGEYPWAPPELVTALVADYLAAGPDFAAAYRAIWRYDLAARAPALTVRALLLSGTADRIAAMQPRARDLLPDLESLVLEGATDFVALQEPERYADAVADFILR